METEITTDISPCKYKIYHAFEDALLHTNFSKLTVSGLSKVAQVSQSTFYFHFIDINDLLEKYITDHLLSELLRRDIQAHPGDGLKYLLDTIDQNRETILSVWNDISANDLHYLYVKLSGQVIKTVFVSKLSTDGHSIQSCRLNDYVRYCAVGIKGVLEAYLRRECPLSDDEVIQSLIAYTGACYSTMLMEP